jgi:putative ABC transport system permease protein
VALVNETFASRYLRNADPIGQRFTMGDREMELTIVGVVPDVPSLRPGEPTPAEVYWSNRQLPRPFTWVMVRTALPPTALFGAVRDRLMAIDPDLAPSSMREYAELVNSRLRSPRFTMLLVISFGIAALLLAAVGVYGLLAYIVSTRQREIGIRLALGAQRKQVLRQHLVWALRIAGIGVTLGIGVALALSRGIESQVAGVSARDPATLLASAALLMVVALLACLLPAYRASRVDAARVLGAD